MIRRPGEDGDRVDVLVQDQLLQRFVGLRALVGLHQPLAPLGDEVADRLHDAVRVLVPLEGPAEAAADDADPDLLR